MSDLQITDVETYVVEGDRPWTFVRLDTDAGVSGIGEAPIKPQRNTIEQIERAGEQLIGKDPFETERHLQPSGVGGLGGAAPNNILATTIAGAFDMACWDIKGRHLDVPVHELLGGAIRTEIPAYANGWDFSAREVVDAYHEGEDPETILDETTDVITAAAADVVEAGYGALKFSPFQWGDGPTTSRRELEYTFDVIEAVHETIGRNVDLLVEGHKHLSTERAIEAARRLERFDPGFYEEPVHAEVGPLKRVIEKSPVPIATGEDFVTHHAYGDLIFDAGVSVVQPDVARAGGITELKKVAALASAGRVGFAPHNAAGPIMTAAAVHVDATEPAFMIQESFEEFSHPDWSADLFEEPLTIEDGTIRVPDRPGLGLELDMDVLRERETTEKWR